MLSVLVGGCNQIPSTAHHKSALPCISSEKSSSFTHNWIPSTCSVVVWSRGRAKPSAVLGSSAVRSRFDLAALVLLFRSFYDNRKFFLFFLVWTRFDCSFRLVPLQRRLIASLFSNHNVRPTCSHNTLWADIMCSGNLPLGPVCLVCIEGAFYRNSWNV